jgi:hypothetical protein
MVLSCYVARPAYKGLDGLPRVTAVGFYWNCERIDAATAPTSRPARRESIANLSSFRCPR